LLINTGGSFRTAGATCARPLTSFVPRPGTSWSGTGLAFTRHQVACTLLARWEGGDKDPWLILTELSPEASDAGWYGLRAWIEHGFKITKRAGWQWHRTRMHDPDRTARLWLAVATLWLLSVGGAADKTSPVVSGHRGGKGANLAKMGSAADYSSVAAGHQSSWLTSSANHLVRSEEEQRRYRDPDGPGSLEVNQQFEFHGSLNG
jgi:hypothetical protein